MKGNRSIRSFRVVLAVFLGTICAAAQAETVTPYRTHMSLERIHEVTASSRTSQKEIETIPAVKIRGRVPNVGFIDGHFNVRRNKTWTSSTRKHGAELTDSVEPILLQGSMGIGGGWRKSGRRIMPTAASIIGNQLKVTFPGRIRGARGTRQRIYTIKMTLNGSIIVTAKISSIPSTTGRRGACGAAVGAAALSESRVSDQASSDVADEGAAVPPVTGNEEGDGTTLARVVTISTDADPEWYAKYGDQSNAVIASIINTAEAIYNRQLGLRFRIVKQHAYSDASPYTSADPGKLLSAFTRNQENPTNLSDNPTTFQDDVDLKHLFTGKDIEGSVIGIAYIGVVCAVPSLSYGISQAYIDVANPGIFAHEVGHNFGANHDSSDRTGLMYPSISIPPSQRFSDVSLGEMRSHVSKYGACISLEQMAPRPNETPGPDPVAPGPDGAGIHSATLKLKKSRIAGDRGSVVRLAGKLLASSSTPLSGVGVRLMVGGEEVGKSVTSSEGLFEFFVRIQLPKGRKVYVYVETEGGEIFSNFLWLGPTESTRTGGSRNSQRSQARAPRHVSRHRIFS